MPLLVSPRYYVNPNREEHFKTHTSIYAPARPFLQRRIADKDNWRNFTKYASCTTATDIRLQVLTVTSSDVLGDEIYSNVSIYPQTAT